MTITLNTSLISQTYNFPTVNFPQNHCKPPSFFTKPTSKTTLKPLFSTSKTPALPQNPVKPDRNAKIRQFCERGKLRDAVELLCQSPKGEIEVGTYCLVLQLCAEKKSLIDGTRVHSDISSNTLRALDTGLGAKLVFMYVHCGNLAEARKIFDLIANDKVYLWNILVNEYAKAGLFKEGVNLYYKMWEFNVEPNEYTFTCVLKCFSGLGFVDEGEIVHGCLLKSDYGGKIAVVNSLISFYFGFGRVESAQKLFDGMPGEDRDNISWNSMISGYVLNGLPEDGVKVFRRMVCDGVLPNLASMVCVITASADWGDGEFGKVVHGYAVKRGYDRDLMCGNTLLDMYSKCGDLEGAVCVFEGMEDRSIVSWTTMLALYTREGLSDAAVRLFYEMKDTGVKPDAFAVTSVLNACACSGSLEHGKEAHDYVKKHKLQSDLSVSNALMDMYFKCGSMVDAEYVFSEMPLKNRISWNIMIGGFSKFGLPNEALNLFIEMQNEFKPDDITISSVLPACSSLASLRMGKAIHGHVLRNGYFSNVYVANALVDMYVKCGSPGFASLVFDKIDNKDSFSWTIMVAGYFIHGLGNEALTTFDEMRNEGMIPDENSYSSILHACVHSGLLKEGSKFFTMMEKDRNFELKLEHYSCMVNLLSNGGRLKEAYKFIEKMPLKPDADVWGALLQGCRVHNDVKLAEQVADHILKLEPENKAYHMLLENIYSEAKTWEKVEWLRSRISHLGLKKNQIYSWIEAKEKVQIFIAENVSIHPEYKSTNALLKKLKARMKLKTCSLKSKYTQNGSDEIEKHVAVCGHSEASAIAFGVLNLPFGTTIRVTKNSKVCHECHETAKLISRAYRRNIILRDSFRFHHFNNGLCSCKG